MKDHGPNCLWKVRSGTSIIVRLRHSHFFFDYNAKKAKPTIASGLCLGSWSTKMPASQSQDKESAINHNEKVLGRLRDAHVKDDPPTPAAGTGCHKNDVSDID